MNIDTLRCNILGNCAIPFFRDTLTGIKWWNHDLVHLIYVLLIIGFLIQLWRWNIILLAIIGSIYSDETFGVDSSWTIVHVEVLLDFVCVNGLIQVFFDKLQFIALGCNLLAWWLCSLLLFDCNHARVISLFQLKCPLWK